MRPVLGIELGPDRIRAVRLTGRRGAAARALEVAWDPDAPDPGVAALRAAAGPGVALAIAIGLPLLHVKRLRLPPLPAPERRRMLALEPERFFATRGTELLCAVTDNDLAFAAPEARVAAWIAALETIGPVLRLEPSPLAYARALARRGVEAAWVVRNGAGAAVELVEVAGREVRQARLVAGGMPDVTALVPPNGATVVRLGAHSGDPSPIAPLAADYLAAYGAALWVDRRSPASLLPPELEDRLAGRRRTARAAATVAAAAALLFSLYSLDASRARLEGRLDAALVGYRERAAPALALEARSDALDREAGSLARVEAERVAPLDVLLELARVLPPDAHLRAMHGAGVEWQVDGYARDAAALVPLTEASPHFAGARLLGATSRAAIGTRTYETFSLAFRYVAAP